MLSLLLDYVNLDDITFNKNGGSSPKRIGDIIELFNSEEIDFKDYDLAIIGVPEERNSFNLGCSISPNLVRNALYSLFPFKVDLKLIDLGNLKIGKTVNDTYSALSNVISELLLNNVIPIIIGGGQDLTYANYLAYEKIGKLINLVCIDSEFDLGKADQEINSKSFLSHIIMHKPNYLFNYSNIGYQTYLTDKNAISLMKNLYFDTYRLGKIQEDLEEVEPIVRNADMISLDISSIRVSDAPGTENIHPNGFYGEEMCRIFRYAGISSKLTSIGLYEINPTYDNRNQTSDLAAQLIWHFIQGFYSRSKDFLFDNIDNFNKFYVQNEEQEIIFYRSKDTGRWWMEIPMDKLADMKYQRHSLIPCSKRDYDMALNGDIPDRWWQFIQKIM